MPLIFYTNKGIKNNELIPNNWKGVYFYGNITRSANSLVLLENYNNFITFFKNCNFKKWKKNSVILSFNKIFSKCV